MEPALAVGISVSVIMLFALLFEKLRLPLILGILLAGMLIGPHSPLAELKWGDFSFSNLIIFDISTVGVFAVIGSALILFGIGLEFSVIRLAQAGPFILLATAIKVGFTYLIANFVLLLLGFPAQTASLVSVALSFSSTPIIIKLLESSGKIRRPEVPFIISILVIEDLIAVFLLGLLAWPSLEGEYNIFFSLVKVLVTFVFAYVVLSRFISKFLSLISHSDELLILGTVSWVLMIGYISDVIGLSFSVGAFLAGSTIAGSFESRKIEDKIRPFNFLFASFFFFSIGLMIDLYSVISNPFLLSVFLFLAVAVRFFAAGISSYLAGFAGRNSSFCSTALLPVSELSLLLLSHGIASNIVPHYMLGSFAFAILVSSFVSTWTIGRENEIYNLLLNISPQLLIKNMRLVRMTILGMRKAVVESSKYYRVVEKLPSITQGTTGVSTREQLAITSKNSVLFALCSLLFFLGIFLVQSPQFSFLSSFFIFVFVLFFFCSALFLVNLSSSFSSLAKMVSRSANGARYCILVHSAAAATFLFLFAAYCIGYFFVPSSLAILLSIPSIAFALKEAILAFKLISFGARL
ncbi:MAG: cation:proton antiporter [Candidatus Micrarchaeota archaeon]|nr:cation:proton antiporter [Candidatus Micrarchaeota archaeon]